MKNGYYLSAYTEVDKLRHLIGYSARHDHNIALFRKDGNRIELLQYWELERITRNKNHNIAFYDVAHSVSIINGLLQPLGLSLNDMNEVWGTPLLDTENEYHSIKDYPEFSYHNLAHLFSGIMMDTDNFYKSSIIGLALDAGPDLLLDPHARSKSQFTGCYVHKGEIALFPVESPGCMWFWAAQHYNMQEGSLMALASASKSCVYFDPQPIEAMDGWDINRWHRGSLRKFFMAVDQLTGDDAGKSCSEFDPLFSESENKISMAMKKVQQLSIENVDKTLQEIIRRYGINPADTYLAMSGGYALNCPTNSYLMNKYNFKGFLSPPCVNDSGLSLGIGLYAFYKKSKAPFSFLLNHAFYGSKCEYRKETIANSSYSSCLKEMPSMNADQIIDDIQLFPIAWFHGAAEIGPRALGNRSLLGDPRSKATKQILNQIKQRQWWRPVAPIILEECIGEWFEEAYVSPFMLHTFRIRDDKRELVPAILHLDNSARVQTVNETTNPAMYRLIAAFYLRTGIPILCNTSLNDKDEPIINRYEEALHFALAKRIPVIYLDGNRIEVMSSDPHNQNEPEPRTPFGIQQTREEKDIIKDWAEVNPHRIPPDIINKYFTLKAEGHEKIDITDMKTAKKIIRWGEVIERNTD